MCSETLIYYFTGIEPLEVLSMYGKVKREVDYILKLKRFIESKYGFMIIDISATKRSFYGETWKVVANNGNKYFAKLDYSSKHKEVYKTSLPIIEHLTKHGIDYVAKVIKTNESKLFVIFDNAVLALFEWIESKVVDDTIVTNKEFQMLSKIYKVSSSGLQITKEDFTAHCVDTYLELFAELKAEAKKGHYSSVLNELEDRTFIIDKRIKRLREVAKKCKDNMAGFVITHGDHGENMMAGDDKYYLVDWDHPLLAPPERDAWFFLNSERELSEFQKSLAACGINYKFSKERLEYYCYYAFFRYLNELIKAYFDMPEVEEDAAFNIAELFDGWIEDIIWSVESNVNLEDL